MPGGIPRILEVDLGTETGQVYERPDLADMLGGSGLAAALLAEHVNYSQAALSPEQPVILAIGPLTALFPVATKVVAMFRSPLTGELGESHAGMRLGLAMRFAGYDAIILKGKAERPLYLVLNSHGVKFKAAGPLWGLCTEETGRILRELEGYQGHRSCLRIGPAGERQIHFAGVNVDTYRHFGRMGLGAVFGSKLLKALVIQGDLEGFPIPYPKQYGQVYREIFDRVTETSVMEKYHGLGTAGNVLALNGLGALPTRNLQSGKFEAAQEISGEAFAEHCLLRKLACAGCPVGCIHLAFLRTSFGEGQEFAFTQLAYDHEVLYALGSLLGLGERRDLLVLVQAVEQAGLDAISTGVALAWATEAQHKGLLSEQELGTRLDFGNLKGYQDAVRNLVSQELGFYRVLGLGTKAAADKFGGEGFALCLGRSEMAGYHTGYANLVGQTVGARHSHLDNAGYSLDQEREGASMEQLAARLLQEEVERGTLTSLCICLFARKAYDFALVERALQSLGLEWDQKKLYELARSVFRQKLALKEKLGYNPWERDFPRRFFETPSLNGMLEPWQAAKLADLYTGMAMELVSGQFTLPQ